MISSSRGPIIKGKLSYLAFFMVVVLVFYPFFGGNTHRTIILNILISAICFLGVYAVSYRRQNLFIASAIGLSWFVISWINILAPASPLILSSLSILLLTLFYGFTAAVIFRFVLKSEKVDDDVLYGAVCVYLFIGGAFAMLYLLMEILQPGSFFIDPAHNPDGIIDAFEFNYYSFVTLTTLGYGDIYPVAPQARALAVFEAIIGVMYLAIIISRLVGIYIAHSMRTK